MRQALRLRTEAIRIGQLGRARVKDREIMKITQAFRFEAAHWLPGVSTQHRCHRLHGHVDPQTGFVVDFFDVEKAFGPVLRRMDHHCLNEIHGLENPTAENIAIWIWQRIIAVMPRLCAVLVYETPDCWAEYNGE